MGRCKILGSVISSPRLLCLHLFCLGPPTQGSEIALAQLATDPLHCLKPAFPHLWWSS